MRSLPAFLLSALGALIVLLMFAAPTGAQTPSPVTATPTPDPYVGLSIDDLAARYYGRGALTVVETMGTYPEFTRYLVSYPSDDLTIYGFMNVPAGTGPFPVIIALHGYIDPAVYGTLDYTTHYADDLARAGFLVLHPNLRGYRPSSDGPNLFRVGMALDVLHLVGLVRQTGGLPGALAPANPDAIGLWGHSMGGGVSLRAITVSADVRAAVLYGAMSGNEAWNYAKIQEWSGRMRGGAEMRAPDEVIRRVSPIEYLGRIQAAVSIHHGAADELVPPEWSADLCQRLNALEKSVECFAYEGQPHTFTGEGDRLFMQRTIDFFNRWLRQG
ncbi:MAG: alpha/beta fold hydrolase [Anaerolineae bacterium]|nr:alpha/beta fold hydrolase [Anaerolineae bacterium]